MGMANPLISQISQSLHYTPFLSVPGYQVSHVVSLSTRRNGGRLIGYALAIFLHFGNTLSVAGGSPTDWHRNLRRGGVGIGVAGFAGTVDPGATQRCPGCVCGRCGPAAARFLNNQMVLLLYFSIF
jgi:hypothetical protein